MSVFDAVLSTLSVVSIPTLLGMLIHARAKNRKINAEASRLESEDISVISATALQLVNPLKERLAEVERECMDLRIRVRELSAEVEHQRTLVADSTAKLELANTRADYYQRAFESRAGGI